MRYERDIDMKKYIVLSVLLAVTCVLFGQDIPADSVSEPMPDWIREAKKAAGSNYIETFAHAFKDPNILIGVFELQTGVSRTTLSTGKVLEDLPGYHEAMIRFSLSKLKCIQPIKGTPHEPVVLVTALMPPVIEARPRIPAFVPLMGSKWILALKKTSKEFRISRFGGQDVEKYTFINDRTMFRVLRYGHGTLCLKFSDFKKIFPNRPEPKKPAHVVQVTEDLVGDFKAIQIVVPYTQKEKKDPNEITAIENTSKALKTDAAKSIFAKVLSGKSG
jgi:hypothetical protein